MSKADQNLIARVLRVDYQRTFQILKPSKARCLCMSYGSIGRSPKVTDCSLDFVGIVHPLLQWSSPNFDPPRA